MTPDTVQSVIGVANHFATFVRNVAACPWGVNIL